MEYDIFMCNIQNLMDYRPMVVFHLPMLVTLDGQAVDTKEKVRGSKVKEL